MIVIDNNKRQELTWLTCKVSPVVSTIKFVGTLFCLSDLCTRHSDRKKMPHTFSILKSFFLRENPCIALQKAN